MLCCIVSKPEVESKPSILKIKTTYFFDKVHPYRTI